MNEPSQIDPDMYALGIAAKRYAHNNGINDSEPIYKMLIEAYKMGKKAEANKITESKGYAMRLIDADALLEALETFEDKCKQLNTKG